MNTRNSCLTYSLIIFENKIIISSIQWHMCNRIFISYYACNSEQNTYAHNLAINVFQPNLQLNINANLIDDTSRINLHSKLDYG